MTSNAPISCICGPTEQKRARIVGPSCSRRKRPPDAQQCIARLRGPELLVDRLDVPYQKCKSYSTSNRARRSVDRCEGLATGEQPSDGKGKEQWPSTSSQSSRAGVLPAFHLFLAHRKPPGSLWSSSFTGMSIDERLFVEQSFAHHSPAEQAPRASNSTLLTKEPSRMRPVRA